jgi:DNA-binding transcriptional MerR regulator
MPYKNKPTEKLFYKIGEVAEMFDVNVSLIRFWEKEFDILKPKKNKKGNRLFTKKDIDNLKIVYHLVKERGFTLEGAKQKRK